MQLYHLEKWAFYESTYGHVIFQFWSARLGGSIYVAAHAWGWA